MQHDKQIPVHDDLLNYVVRRPPKGMSHHSLNTNIGPVTQGNVSRVRHRNDVCVLLPHDDEITPNVTYMELLL
jgi:hypothetical protein